ncbi:hypothetical protein [Streptomyces goshikiensis]|uniref:hypothetical protein n=1 Tax=Streptomyces goshikiensis TaxID=1942 RepID=UPI003653A5EF
MPTAAERQFHLDMVAGAQRLKREIGYNPVRFTQLPRYENLFTDAERDTARRRLEAHKSATV